MPADLRVGIIGVGIWGAVHIDTVRAHPGATVAALCDVDRDKAEQAARKVPDAAVFDDYEEMVTEADLDAVHVVTPEFAHHGPVLAAARRGLHVLCEKPMAPTAAECQEMMAAAEEAGVTLMVDFHSRWNPPYALLKQRLDAGELGRPIYGYFKHADSKVVPREMIRWAERTSILWFVGCHCVDLLRWLLGEEVVRVDGRALSGALRAEGVDVDDAYLTLLEFESGATFVMENAWCLPDEETHFLDPRLQLVGTEGSAYVSVVKNDALQLYTRARGAETPDVLIAPEVHGVLKGYATDSIHHFLDCVAAGRPPMVDGFDGLQTTRVIEAIYRSIEAGHPVELDPWEHQRANSRV
jgi:predicted dehydrogenase